MINHFVKLVSNKRMGTIVGGAKSFSRQETKYKRHGGATALYPPLWCCIFTTSYYQSIGVLYVSSIGVWVLYVSSIPLSNILLVVGGIYFFLKFFWESNSRELAKAINK